MFRCSTLTFIFHLFVCFSFSQNNSLPQSAIDSVTIDFSGAGYGGNEKTIPFVPAILFVKPGGSNDTRLIQSAIDYIAQLPLGKMATVGLCS